MMPCRLENEKLSFFLLKKRDGSHPQLVRILSLTMAHIDQGGTKRFNAHEEESLWGESMAAQAVGEMVEKAGKGDWLGCLWWLAGRIGVKVPRHALNV